MLKIKRLLTGLLAAALCMVVAGTASAVVFNLRAAATTVTMPDGTVVPMWGYALESSPGAGDGTVMVPGPLLVVPSGDTTLTINLTNRLPRPTSLHIIGQMIANNSGPVWTNGLTDTVISSGSRPQNNYTARVRSFTHETATNATQTYQWTNVRPGTFIYQSGTNPAMQVSMGLYGGMIAGSRYSNEVILFFSEIDPIITNAVANGDYGPGRLVPSTIDYHPRYFLINGKAYPDLQPFAAARNANEDILLRFFNAGLETHIPTILNTPHMSIVAEDGVPFTYPKRQVTVELLAGKTVEAVLKPTEEGQFALYDRRLNLTNAGSVYSGGGGMLASLWVGPTPVPGAPVTLAPISLLLLD